MTVVVTNNNFTLLAMSTIGVPLYSARGLTQVLTPAPEAKPTPRRTINGELRWLGLTQMQKFDSTITCTDQEAPAFDGLWPGMSLIIDCVCELGYPIGGSPIRPVVSGSSRSNFDATYTYYRPQITFMVVDYQESNAEYQHDYQWQLNLREI